MAASVAAVAAVSFGVGGAGAGLFGCSYPTLTQAFAPWGDLARYYLSPGGGFEPGTAWSLAGGAAVVPGNETFHVNGAGDARSLLLPPGAAAQGPSSCIVATDLKVRMFVRSDDSSPVRVDVIVPGLLGLVRVVGSYTVATGPAWQPSQAIVNLGNLLSLTSLSSANIAVRVTSTGSSAAQVDDVYVDPSWND